MGGHLFHRNSGSALETCELDGEKKVIQNQRFIHKKHISQDGISDDKERIWRDRHEENK